MSKSPQYLKWKRYSFRLSSYDFTRRTKVYAPSNSAALLGSGKIDQENATLVSASKPVIPPIAPSMSQVHQMLRGTARSLDRVGNASQALGLTSIQLKSPLLRGVIGEIREHPSRPLSEGFSQYTDIFGEALPYQIKAGETAGTLGPVFNRAAIQYFERITMQRAVAKALTLPVLNLLAFGIIFLAFILFGIPTIMGTFTSRGMDIPWDFQAMMTLSNLLKESPIIWMGALIGGTIAFLQRKQIMRSAAVEYFLMNCPVVRDIYRKAMVYLYFTELADLIDASVPVKQSYDIVIGIAQNRWFKRYFSGIQTDLVSGMSQSEAFLRNAKFIGPDGFYIAGSMDLSEKTGDMTTGIRDFCKDFKEEVRFKMDVLPSFLMISSTVAFALVAAVLVFRIWMGVISGLEQELQIISGFIGK